MLSRDDILRARDLPIEEVNIPEWGGSVRVRALTAGERDSFEMEMKDGRDGDQRPNIRGTLAVRTLVDEDGKRLFQDHDAATLAALHSKPLDRIFTVAARLSGITPDDVEVLEKNSVNGRPGYSSSSSHSISAAPSPNSASE
jgi:hypothetical protein